MYLAGALYVWQAVNYFHVGQYGMLLAFVGYAIGNAGFILAARGL